MSGYNLENGYSNNGKSIKIIVSWKHEANEICCLAATDDATKPELKILDSGNFTKTGSSYEFFYPFETPGMPWRVYVWRVTTQNASVFYTGERVPVEAILSKIYELGDKSEEAGLLYRRAIMTPEDTNGSMFLPTKEARRGKVLGFGDDGKPVVGEACEQVKELYEAQKNCEESVKKASAYASDANRYADQAGEHSFDANQSVAEAVELAEKAKGHALEAQGWYQKTAEEGAEAVAATQNNAGAAQLAATNAENSANRAQEIVDMLALDKEEIDKKLCYTACAAKQTQAAVQEVKDAGTQAKTDIGADVEQVQQLVNDANASMVLAAQSASDANQFKTQAQQFAKKAETLAEGMSRVYKYKGSVSTVDALPSSGNEVGDVWNVASSGRNYAWDGAAWDSLAGDVEFATADDFEALSAEVDNVVVNKWLVQYLNSNNSDDFSRIHGKVVFATSNDSYDGGFYVAGSSSSRVTWQQWLSRYQWDRIRTFGATYGEYDDYILFPKPDGSNAHLQIARMKDIPDISGKSEDNAVVHLAGNETITGVKIFNGAVEFNGKHVYIANALHIGSPGGGEINVLPLGKKTAMGADAYGLHVSLAGGLQLFGTHFLQGDVWTDASLKIVANNVSLYSTDEAAIGFDYANKVVFRTMPNDGTEATYELQAWEWDDDSHTSKSASAGVKLLKPSQKTELEPNSVLNMQEGDERWNCIKGSSGRTLLFDETQYGNTLIVELGEDSYLFFGLPSKHGNLALDGDVVHKAGAETITGVKTFANLVKAEGGIATKTLRSIAGSAIFDTTDSRGLNFRGIFTLNGYDINNPQTGVPFFKQENANTNWIDVTTLKQGGVPLDDIYARITDLDAKADKNTVVLGEGATVSGDGSVVLGKNADDGDYNGTSVVIGKNASNYSGKNVVIGHQAQAAIGSWATAVGSDAHAYGDCSTAVGSYAVADDPSSCAFGAAAKADGAYSVAVGAEVVSFVDSLALFGTSADGKSDSLCIGVINDDNPGFVFVETKNNSTNSCSVSGVRISKENFMAMLKQFGGVDWTVEEKPTISNQPT